MLSISEIILSIEGEVDIEQFQFKNEKVWPIIRMQMYTKGILAKNKSADKSPSKELVFLLLIQSFLALFWARFKARGKHLVITAAEYQVAKEGIVSDRILSDYLEVNAPQYYTVMFGLHPLVKLKWKQHYDLHGFGIHFIAKMIMLLSHNKSIEGDFGKLEQLIKQHNLRVKVSDIKHNILYAQALENVYNKIFRWLKTKKVYVACFYATKNMAGVKAAQGLDISVTDVQHGIQGKNHMGYSHWPLTVLNDYVPKKFAVWNKSSADTIHQWLGTKGEVSVYHKKIDAGLLSNLQKQSKVLISLQAGVEPLIADEVVEAIKNTADITWYVRPHPRQIDKNEIDVFLEAKGILREVEFRSFVDYDIYEELAQCKLHITPFSTVAIEAQAVFTPTYFTMPEGVELFRDQLEYDYLKNNKHSTLTSCLKEVFNNE